MTDEHLLLLGASTRAIAFSALRAGLRPLCCDLFADADLQARCPVTRLSGRYPHGFLDWLRAAEQAPWMYTGGLENWPALVARMARQRPLLGNDAPALERARAPGFVCRLLQQAGLPVPEVMAPGTPLPAGRRWLMKPLRGAGGSGVRFVKEHAARERGPVYVQEYIEGEPHAVLYAGNGRAACLLGMSRQLVGADFFHAAPFHYCGSIGPLEIPAVLREGLDRLGIVLAHGCGLRGLFGVDGVVRDGSFWPVEINPRYTASVEVLEHGLGLKVLRWHCQGCAGDDWSQTKHSSSSTPSHGWYMGKAILFARQDLVFPADGPWLPLLRSPPPIDALPTHADLPAAGEAIRAGRPILTFFARAESVEACREALHAQAADLDRWLCRR